MGDLRGTRFGSVLEGKGCVGVCDGVMFVAAAKGRVLSAANQRLAGFCCECLFFIQAQVTATRQVRHK